MPEALALEVSKDVDELPTEVEAALEAEEVLSAHAAVLHRLRARATVLVIDKVVFRKSGIGIPGEGLAREGRKIDSRGEKVGAKIALKMGEDSVNRWPMSLMGPVYGACAWLATAFAQQAAFRYLKKRLAD